MTYTISAVTWMAKVLKTGNYSKVYIRSSWLISPTSMIFFRMAYMVRPEADMMPVFSEIFLRWDSYLFIKSLNTSFRLLTSCNNGIAVS